MKKKVTVSTLNKKKKEGEKMVMITAYDFPSARMVDEGGVDMILVGDSLGMVVLGYENTLPVTMEDMIHHTSAVVRGASNALIVADMPFMSFQVNVEETLKNAGRLVKEAGAEAVKLEGGREILPQVKALVQAGIPVMGHLGLTPQSVNQLGGFKVQGKQGEAARKLIEDARLLQEAGIFALVLECIPRELARKVTEELSIPTIGIGAGPYCDGQVLVYHDLLGIFDRFTPRFVKKYARAGEIIKDAVARYSEDVRKGNFPGPEHSFTMDAEELKKLEEI